MKKKDKKDNFIEISDILDEKMYRIRMSGDLERIQRVTVPDHIDFTGTIENFDVFRKDLQDKFRSYIFDYLNCDFIVTLYGYVWLIKKDKET